MHKRPVIKDKILKLLTGATLAEDRVYASRSDAYTSKEFPVMAIYLGKERSNKEQEGTNNYKRILPVFIEALVDDVSAEDPEGTIDATLQEIADQVEEVFFNNPRIGLRGTVEDSKIVESEAVIDLDGEKITGGIRLEWEIEYITMR